MVHVYFKYLFFLFSIAVNNINVTPYPELANKIAFLRIFYIATYKKPEILALSRKRTKIYDDTKKIAKQKKIPQTETSMRNLRPTAQKLHEVER